MIKILLRSLVIILLFSGCGGGGNDGFLYPKIGSFSLVEISNICDKESSDYVTQNFELLCDAFNELDYIENPPEICEEITLTDRFGNSHTGLFVYAQKDQGCY